MIYFLAIDGSTKRMLKTKGFLMCYPANKLYVFKCLLPKLKLSAEKEIVWYREVFYR